jgi:hypothetical protein
MSVSILEALQNADYNLQNNGMFGIAIAKDQIHNAVELLLKGHDLTEQVEPLLEKYSKIENVPEKNYNKPTQADQ